jgi:hypothetical protein
MKIIPGLLMAIIGFILIGISQYVVTSGSLLEIIIGVGGFLVVVGGCDKLYKCNP